MISNIQLYSMHLHLKLRQADEKVRIYTKHDDQLLHRRIEKRLYSEEVRGNKTIFNMLMSAVSDSKGRFEPENLAKECQHTEDIMRLCRTSNTKCNWEEME